MIKGMLDVGSMPVLERLVQFTGARHRVITHNIANLSTPHFRPQEVSIADFQKELGHAIDRRRSGRGVFNGPLETADTRQVAFREDGLDLTLDAAHDNLLFHDRNDRSLEHQMKGLAENAMTHNAALELLKNQLDLLRSTIQERP